MNFLLTLLSIPVNGGCHPIYVDHAKKNTFGLPPAFRELDITIRLVPDELLSPLLDDLRPGGRSKSHDYYKFSEITSGLGQPESDTLLDVRRR